MKIKNEFVVNLVTTRVTYMKPLKMNSEHFKHSLKHFSTYTRKYLGF